ncbi:MAG: DUF1292 domain-containing protein [Lachnospiraceae bacterium]|jgi:hypothetical protein
MSKHKHGPGCDHDCREEDVFTVDLEFDDGETVACEPLFVFEVDDKEYVALVPVDEESDDIYLYEYHDISEDEFEFLDIEDDEVFDKVVEECGRILEEAEAFEEDK